MTITVPSILSLIDKCIRKYSFTRNKQTNKRIIEYQSGKCKESERLMTQECSNKNNFFKNTKKTFHLKAIYVKKKKMKVMYRVVNTNRMSGY